MDKEIFSSLGYDPIFYRIELSIFLLLLTLASISTVIFISFKATPRKMIGYRKHIFDSLFSCGMFSLASIVFFTVYAFYQEGDKTFYFFSISTLSSINSSISLKPLLVFFFLNGTNCPRSIILCFEYRFRGIVYGEKRTKYMWFRKIFLHPLLLSPFPIFIAGVYRTAQPADFRAILNQSSSFLSPSVIVQPYKMTLAALDIGLILLILSIYLWLLVFYIGATFVLLHFSKKVASYQSKKMLKMQKIAFWLLIIQAAGCLFPAGLTVIILMIAFLTESPGVTSAFNYSYWFLFSSFGFFYPIVILLTTRPYMIYMQQLISIQINVFRATKDESPAMTSWATPSKTRDMFRRRFTMIGSARVNRVINS